MSDELMAGDAGVVRRGTAGRGVGGEGDGGCGDGSPDEGDPPRSGEAEPEGKAESTIDPAAAESPDIRIYVEETGPHLLEIITHAEWAVLTPEEGPEQFLRHSRDIFVRFSPEGP